MANPVVGHVECPHCGETATVHREARGLRALYYRCYDADGLSMRCGTVQIRGPSGQTWIMENMRGMDDERKPEPVQVQPKEPVAETPTRRRRGLWDLVATGGEDD